ncbi:MAG: HD-GYP domain-containing protein [Candidatus Marinarcus sp.]|uniref:HD-GYP domain-containing protein n=1 Tax=Candidatus Marinarcus sp. TaxID=3100987 RepID=UPI003B00D21E
MNRNDFLFTPIAKDILEEGNVYPYNLYRKVDEKIFTLILKKDKVLNQINGKKLSFSDNLVYINAKDRRLYQEYIQSHISNIIDNKEVSIESKVSLINQIASTTMNDLFESEVTSENLIKINSVINDTIKLMLNESNALYAMLKVTSYDYYTYTHCVDVAAYAIGFGIYLNLCQHDLETLGKAAMLHDLGKKGIDNKIITKNGALTLEEFEIVKEHPTLSVKMLEELGEEDRDLLVAIGQHHEKCNGKGYPKGLYANEICELAKIVSICDVFNALTTRRTYKDRMSSFHAFKIMCGEMLEDLSKEHLAKFIRFMGCIQQ